MIEGERSRDGHVVILHRWPERVAHYASYLDHVTGRVTYVATPASWRSVPRQAAGVVTVDDLADPAQVDRALGEPIARFGAPTGVVALHGADQLTAALLRERHGCPGRRRAGLRPFLENDVMVEAARATGVTVPRTQVAHGPAQIHDLARTAGWPLVVRTLLRRAGAPDRLLRGPAEVAALAWGPGERLVVQERTRHPVYHADGYFDGEHIEPWRLARHLDAGGAVGEVDVDDPAVLAAAGAFLHALVPGLSAEPWVFHCELCIDTRGPAPACTFLSVACQPGGGEIPLVWREVYGVDLMEVELSLQLGERAVAPALVEPTPIGGSLRVPLTGPRPARIAGATPMCGRAAGPYAEVVPAVGSIVAPVAGGDEGAGGRFRFSGRTTEEVTGKILATARDYVVRGEPLDDVMAAAPRIERIGRVEAVSVVD
jgi:hypothetical protein